MKIFFFQQEKTSRCLELNAFDIMLAGQSSSPFFCTGPFGGVWGGRDGGGGGPQISWIFEFVPCSHHVLPVPQTIPQHVLNSSKLLYDNLCQKP